MIVVLLVKSGLGSSLDYIELVWVFGLVSWSDWDESLWSLARL
jgi:hypothetical protein